MLEMITKAKNATRSIFLVCGLGISSWAPMVPFAKERLQLNDASLGLLLLLLGGGAITMMPISGYLGHKYGNRIVILIATLVIAVMLPLLLFMNTVWTMAICLFIFGSAIGTVDVAMNSHAVQVEHIYGKPIMSSFHGLFSTGGLFGALGLGFLIKMGLTPIATALSISVLLVLIVSRFYTSFLDHTTQMRIGQEQSSDIVPAQNNAHPWLKKSVLFLGMMCFFVFLSEGAMLDWSAVFLHENRGVEEELAGMGYAAFSVAMATMRLFGDGIVSRLSGRVVVVGGSLIAAMGLLIVVFTPWAATSLFGFILLGLGAANIVPVFFSEAGRLKNIPASVSIPAITTIGYAGQLAGPALLGFIAHWFSLPAALGFTGSLFLIVALAYTFKKTV